MTERIDTREDANAFITYSAGIVAMSVCAPAAATKEDVERFANADSPTGISSRWQVIEPTFSGGEPNGGPCNTNPERRHWLLTC